MINARAAKDETIRTADKPVFRAKPPATEATRSGPAGDEWIPVLPPPPPSDIAVGRKRKSPHPRRASAKNNPATAGAVGFKRPRIDLAPLRDPGENASLPVLTLEAAYERALATDQSLQIAYLNSKKARLEPRKAFYAFLPTLRADLSYRQERERETRSSAAETSINRTLDRRPLEISDSINATGSTSTSVTSALTPGAGGSTTASTRTSTTLANSQSSTLSSSASRNTRILHESTRDRTRESVDTNTPGFGLTFTQPLVDMSVFPAYRVGRLAEKVALLQQQAGVRQVLFSVTTAYYDVLKLQRIVRVDEEAVTLTGQQLSLAQLREEVGEVIHTDVLRAQVAVESARRTLIQSRNALLATRETLANVLNMDAATFRVVEVPDYPGVIPPVDVLVDRAYLFREDYRVSGLNVATDIERRNEIKAGYYPTVEAQLGAQWLSPEGSSTNRLERDQWQSGTEQIQSGTAFNSIGTSSSTTNQLSTSTSTDLGVGAVPKTETSSSIQSETGVTSSSGMRSSSSSSPYTVRTRERTSSSDAFDGSNARWDAVVSVNLPIFDIIRLDTEMAIAKYQIMQTNFVRAQLAKNIQQEVVQAWRIAHTLGESLTAVRAQIGAAEEGYRNLQEQYRVGAATGIEVGDALAMLNASRRDLAVLNYDYQVALRNLEQVTGVFEERRVARTKAK